MIPRLTFFFITVFWVTMNTLLWRAEFGSARNEGSAVPLEMVWQKILTAPDNSSLNLFYEGRKVGFLISPVISQTGPSR